MNLSEMSVEQKAALELFLMVSPDNEYKPMSYSEIATALTSKGMKASKSSVGRWAKLFDFEEQLKNHINALLLSNKQAKDDVMTAASSENLKCTLMTLNENNELLHLSHTILKTKLQLISKKYETTQIITLDDAKFVQTIYAATSSREDKLHDRQAGLLAAQLMSKTDLIGSFSDTEVLLEED